MWCALLRPHRRRASLQAPPRSPRAPLRRPASGPARISTAWLMRPRTRQTPAAPGTCRGASATAAPAARTPPRRVSVAAQHRRRPPASASAELDRPAPPPDDHAGGRGGAGGAPPPGRTDGRGPDRRRGRKRRRPNAPATPAGRACDVTLDALTWSASGGSRRADGVAMETDWRTAISRSRTAPPPPQSGPATNARRMSPRPVQEGACRPRRRAKRGKWVWQKKARQPDHADADPPTVQAATEPPLAGTVGASQSTSRPTMPASGPATPMHHLSPPLHDQKLTGASPGTPISRTCSPPDPMIGSCDMVPDSQPDNGGPTGSQPLPPPIPKDDTLSGQSDSLVASSAAPEEDPTSGPCDALAASSTGAMHSPAAPPASATGQPASQRPRPRGFKSRKQRAGPRGEPTANALDWVGP
ncbi:hypothetical protein ZWY2020_039744 [Hordeum vulgare]|nr:hypothetical protein ZWY2020_039744 [Hordeum vulgare]